MIFTPDKGTSSWAKKNMICRTKKKVSCEDLLDLIQEKGFLNTKISSLALDTCVLSPETEEEKIRFLEMDEEWKSMHFSFVREWEENDRNGRRKVWLGIYGVPLHAWCDQLFRKIGNTVEKVVQIEEDTTLKKQLERGNIQIETPNFDQIRRKLNIKIWNRLYEVNMIEEGPREIVLENKKNLEKDDGSEYSPESENSGSELPESDKEDEESRWRDFDINDERVELSDREDMEPCKKEAENLVLLGNQQGINTKTELKTH